MGLLRNLVDRDGDRTTKRSSNRIRQPMPPTRICLRSRKYGASIILNQATATTMTKETRVIRKRCRKWESWHWIFTVRITISFFLIHRSRCFNKTREGSWFDLICMHPTDFPALYYTTQKYLFYIYLLNCNRRDSSKAVSFDSIRPDSTRLDVC